MALIQAALVGKSVAPWRNLIDGSMFGSSYTLLMASDRDDRSVLNDSICSSMRAQDGTLYRGFKDSVLLGLSSTSL